MLTSNIESIIKESGLKKNFIATKLGVTVRQLRKYETGDSLIPMDKAYILANMVGRKVDDFYEYNPQDEI